MESALYHWVSVGHFHMVVVPLAQWLYGPLHFLIPGPIILSLHIFPLFHFHHHFQSHQFIFNSSLPSSLLLDISRSSTKFLHSATTRAYYIKFRVVITNLRLFRILLLIMLRCSTPEVFSDGSSSEMSVLERQKAMMQRLCFNQQELTPQQAGLPLFQYQNMVNSQNLNQSLDDISPNFGFACSGIAAGFEVFEQHQRSFSTVSGNSSKDHRMAPARKRKAQVFDAEAESKDKMLEGEVESCVTVKIEKESSCKTSKANSKASESAPKTDYIHVRARRGQATDSHSLAERARREKITKKMKCLQELVPGCNKVIGKAGMLDEIINYVQSLQKQVEFLSMKLAALNPRMDFNLENFFMKELSAYIASFPSTATATPIELINASFLQYNQGPQVTASDLALNTTQLMSQKAVTSSIPYPETYMDSISNLQQVQQISESDWQSIYNLSFH